MATLYVKYKDVVDRCKMLSSYEAQSARGAAGNSLYAQMRITDGDDAYIYVLLEQGMKIVEARLNGVLMVETEFDKTVGDDKCLQITIGKDLSDCGATTSSGSFVRALSETLVSYVLERWFEDKLTERSQAYGRMFEQMAESVKIIGLKRKKPTMEED